LAVTQVTKANNVSLTVLPSPARLIRENNATYVEIAERKIFMLLEKTTTHA